MSYFNSVEYTNYYPPEVAIGLVGGTFFIEYNYVKL